MFFVVFVNKTCLFCIVFHFSSFVFFLERRAFFRLFLLLSLVVKNVSVLFVCFHALPVACPSFGFARRQERFRVSELNNEISFLQFETLIVLSNF